MKMDGSKSFNIHSALIEWEGEATLKFQSSTPELFGLFFTMGPSMDKATEEDKNQCAFSSLEIYTDLCWIVYGLKGVAMFYLDDDGRWSTVQLMGGVDDEEHVFSHQRGKHYDPTIRDCNQTLGRDAGLKSNTFSMRLKASTGV